MRNISLLSLALILLNLNLFSQMRDPNQHKFFVTDSVYLNSNNPAFSINRFHLGWQLGGERLI